MEEFTLAAVLASLGISTYALMKKPQPAPAPEAPPAPPPAPPPVQMMDELVRVNGRIIRVRRPVDQPHGEVK